MATPSWLKMQNIFGPEPQQDQRFGDMPSRLPTSTGPYQSGSYQTPVRGTLDTWMPPDQRANMMYQGEEDNELMDAFKQSVLNPPVREHMTYPKTTLNTLEAALKIAAEPSPTEKNRVYINDQAYQKQRVMYDPVTGEQKFITNVKDPSFSDQVLRAMAAGGMQGPIDVLNQPYQDQVADFKLRNEALKDAVSAQSNTALAQQRYAQAGYTGQRADLERQRIDISRMTAEERARVSQLNTLTDAQKIQMLQDGRISLAELQAAEALKRVNVQQAGASARTGMQQAGATSRTQMQQSGATARNQASIASAERRNQASIAGAMARTQAQIKARTDAAAARGLSPSQQKVELQSIAAQITSERPEWDEQIEYDQQGFPYIKEDAPDFDEIYRELYGTIPGTGYSATPGTDINLPATPTAVTPSGQTAPIGTPGMQGPGVQRQIVKKEYSPSRNQTRITYSDGTQQVVSGRQ